jgi:hypothetical protein
VKLDEGVLPWDEPRKIWIGYGQRRPCDACEQPILPAQVEHALDFSSDHKIQLHAGCAALYQVERTIRGHPRRPRADGTDQPAGSPYAMIVGALARGVLCHDCVIMSTNLTVELIEEILAELRKSLVIDSGRACCVCGTCQGTFGIITGPASDRSDVSPEG